MLGTQILYLAVDIWYFQTKLVVLLIAIVVLILLAIINKKRNRKDVLPNEHILLRDSTERNCSFKVNRCDTAQ